MNDNKLNKKIVIEKPIYIEKKKSNHTFLKLFIIFLICALIAFAILEKLNYIDYLSFI